METISLGTLDTLYSFPANGVTNAISGAFANK